MDFPHDSMTQNSPQAVNRRFSGNTSVSEVFGFPVAANQFSILQSSQPAETQCQEQEDVGLVDPRTTRHLRIAAQRADDRGSQADVGSSATVPTHRNTQGILYSGNAVNPVVAGDGSQFVVQNSFSVSSSEVLTLQTGEPVHYSLGNGVNVAGQKLYGDFNCNKRISHAGPEWSAGRPGHTPTRRTFACEKLVEDSYAGQDWSAGRPGTRPFGASTAACLSPQTACIGPSGSAIRQQLNTGYNNREEKSFTESTSPLTTDLPRHEDQNTIQQRSTSLRRQDR